ncbi:MAG: hypothetical protein RL367_2587, partial [Pseudomonadota bacterium]
MPSPPTDFNAAITEFALAWPGAAPAMPTAHMMPMSASMDMFNCCVPGGGSTHELVYDRNGGKVFWVSGQNYDHIARVSLDGSAVFFPMPTGSMPHGTAFDQAGQLWVTFEGLGELARINPDGSIAERIDIKIQAKGAAQPLNPRPHGLGIGADGALWFTGKLTNTVGRVDTAGHVHHFALPTIGAVPIYIAAGPGGSMWCTELGGSKIARVSDQGAVSEFAIPTPDSRPIAIVKAPDGQSMWFSQEAGGKVGRIDPDGSITEYPVPLTRKDAILGGLAFDADGNLWVQQYIKPPAFGPAGDDYIVKMGSSLQKARPGDISGVTINWF